MSVPNPGILPEEAPFVTEHRGPGFWLVGVWVSLGWVAHPAAFWGHTHLHWLAHDAMYAFWVLSCWVGGALIVRAGALWGVHRRSLKMGKLPPTHPCEYGNHPEPREHSLESKMDHAIPTTAVPVPTDAFCVGGHLAQPQGHSVDPPQDPSHPSEAYTPRCADSNTHQSDHSYCATTAQRNPQRMASRYGRPLRRTARPHEQMPSHPSSASYHGTPPNDELRPRIPHQPRYKSMPQLMDHQQAIHDTINATGQDQPPHVPSSDWFRYCHWWELRYPLGYFLSWGVSWGLLHWTWR